MMERALAKLIRLIALTNWSEKDLNDLIRSLPSIPPSEFVRLVKAARDELSESLPRSPKQRRGPYLYDPSLDKAYDLLMELPTSATSTARKLKRVIGQHHPGLPLRGMRAKEGLREWLEYVAEMISTSELLHFCHVVRNELIDPEEGPWSLRSDTSK